MEDAATAEISRAQLWQWIRHGCRTSEGEVVTAALYERERDAVLARLAGDGRIAPRRRGAGARRRSCWTASFAPFLTLRAGELLP